MVERSFVLFFFFIIPTHSCSLVFTHGLVFRSYCRVDSFFIVGLWCGLCELLVVMASLCTFLAVTLMFVSVALLVSVFYASFGYSGVYAFVSLPEQRRCNLLFPTMSIF